MIVSTRFDARAIAAAQIIRRGGSFGEAKRNLRVISDAWARHMIAHGEWLIANRGEFRSRWLAGEVQLTGESK
jgi:hypothetical protein